MYEYFDLDLEKVSFEWDEVKEEVNNIIRLISTRLATVPEKERYENDNDEFE